MKRLFLIEFQKVWKNSASRTLTIIYFVLLTFIGFIASMKVGVGVSMVEVADQGIFDFPYIWHFNTYIADWFKLFLAVVIVSMMANEYTYGTLKQNLIDGLSKQEFIASKFLMVVAFALASTFFVLVLSLVLGFSYSSTTELNAVFSGTEYLLAYFVKLVGFFSFCLFLGIWVKRSAFALGFLLGWYILESILSGLFHWVIFPNNTIADSIIRLFPLESMSNLIVEPFTRMSMINSLQSSMAGKEFVKDYSVHFSSIGIVMVWTSVFVYLSYRTLQKRDL